MTPLRAALLTSSFFFAFASASRAEEAPVDPFVAVARAYVKGDAVRQALPPGAGDEKLSKIVAAAEIVQSGGTDEQDDADFKKAALASADALKVTDPGERDSLFTIYRKRRAAGLRAASGIAPGEESALRRMDGLKKNVSGKKNPFATRDPGAGGVGGADGGRTLASTPPTPGGGTTPSPTPNSVDAVIAAAKETPGSQAPKGFSLRPAAVPSLGANPDGSPAAVSPSAPLTPTPPEPPVLPRGSKLLDPDKFPAYGQQKEGRPTSDADIARIERTFHATVARLVKEGKRASGSGAVSGVINNMQAIYSGKKERCYDQAEELLGDLAKEFGANPGPQFVEPRGRWLFKMTTYTGEGHEANGHYWVTAISREPGDPTLVLDPWKDTIVRSSDKNPIAVKPFLPYAMGFYMSKILD